MDAGSPDALHAVIEHLATSGHAVAGLGETLAMSHAAADLRVESALAGLPGLTRDAMANRAQDWSTTTNTLVGRAACHAEHLHGSAREFAAMVDDHVAALTIVQSHCAASDSAILDARDL